MPETVNEIQVAFSANVKDLIQQLKNLSGNIDNTIAQLNEMETASDNLAESEEGLADKSKTVTAGHKNMTSELSKAANETDTASKKTEKYTGVLGNLKSETENVRTVFSSVAGVLGTFGITVGVTQLIDQIKQLADEAKSAYNEMQKLTQKSSYKYALTAEQDKLATSLSQYTSISSGVSLDTAKNIYGALLNVYPELEKDTAQLEKMANAFASVSAMEGITDMSSFMTDVFITAAKYDIKGGEGIIKFITDLEAASQLSAGMGGNAQQFLNVMKNADKSAQYMGMTWEETLAYLGSSYKAGNGEDAAKMMSSMESYVNKAWSEVLTQMGEKGIDTSQLQGTDALQKWWSAVLKAMPDTIDETEISNYLVTQGLKKTSADEIAKGITASGGAEQFKALMTDTIINLYQGSLEEYRSSTMTGEDYKISQKTSSDVKSASIWSYLGDYFTNIDQYNAMNTEVERLLNEILVEYGHGEVYSEFLDKGMKVITYDREESVKNYNEFIKEARNLLERQNNIQPQQFVVNVQVTTDTSYAKANADVRTANGNASSLTTS